MERPSLHDQINTLPTFKELPKLPDLPQGCTWGLWDKGSRDELWTLNLLTTEAVKRAGAEIREGISVSLKYQNQPLPPVKTWTKDLTKYSWSLDKPTLPVFRRQKLVHKIIDNSTFSSSASFGDEVAFNTQSGSQWDALRHAVYREKSLLYNGVTKDEVLGTNSTDALGINSESSPLLFYTITNRNGQVFDQLLLGIS